MYEWLWIGALVVFSVIEDCTMSLVSVWFAGGSIAAVIAKLLGADFWGQLIVFLAGAAVLLLLLRRVAFTSIRKKPTRTNLDRILGESVIVEDEVDNAKNTGGVKLGDISWRAKSENGEIIKKGERATVADIDGVKLVLRK